MSVFVGMSGTIIWIFLTSGRPAIVRQRLRLPCSLLQEVAELLSIHLIRPHLHVVLDIHDGSPPLIVRQRVPDGLREEGIARRLVVESIHLLEREVFPVQRFRVQGPVRSRAFR